MSVFTESLNNTSIYTFGRRGPGAGQALHLACAMRQKRRFCFHMIHRIPLVALMAFSAAPASASAAAQVPEASSVTLFALGVLGVIIGRRLSMRKSDRDD